MVILNIIKCYYYIKTKKIYFLIIFQTINKLNNEEDFTENASSNIWKIFF